MSSMTASKQKSLATFGLLFGAVVWGVIWYPYRVLEEAGISGATASVATYAFALLIGCVVFLRDRPQIGRFSWVAVALALATGWANLGYVLAVIDGEVMRVLLLFYLSPFWTLLLARLLLGENPGPRGILVIALSLIGAFIMLWQPGSQPIPQNTSEWLALSAGFSFALGNVLTRKSTHLTVATKSFAVWAGVVVLALLLFPFAHVQAPNMDDIATSQWLLMLALGGVMMLATLLVQYGLTHTLATRASVIFLFELVVAALTSWWLAHEAMSLREWIGGVMIVAAALFAPQGD